MSLMDMHRSRIVILGGHVLVIVLSQSAFRRRFLQTLLTTNFLWRTKAGLPCCATLWGSVNTAGVTAAGCSMWFSICNSPCTDAAVLWFSRSDCHRGAMLTFVDCLVIIRLLSQLNSINTSCCIAIVSWLLYVRTTVPPPLPCRTGHGRLAGSGGLDGDGSP